MNATNRGRNRVILFLIGAILIGLGASVVMATVWTAADDIFRSWTSTSIEWMLNADKASRLPQTTTVSWFTLGLLVVLLLIVIAAVMVVARLGGGRSSAVIRVEAGDGVQGSVTIHHGFASEAITHSLASHDEILSSRVNTRHLRGTDVLHVSVTPRQNTSPVEVAETVTKLVDNLATLLGQQTPTLVSVRSGIRSRVAADQSRVS